MHPKKDRFHQRRRLVGVRRKRERTSSGKPVRISIGLKIGRAKDETAANDQKRTTLALQTACPLTRPSHTSHSQTPKFGMDQQHHCKVHQRGGKQSSGHLLEIHTERLQAIWIESFDKYHWCHLWIYTRMHGFPEETALHLPFLRAFHQPHRRIPRRGLARRHLWRRRQLQLHPLPHCRSIQLRLSITLRVL